MAKNLFGKHVGNFVNALLHAIEKDKEEISTPQWYIRKQDPKNEQTLHALARFYSIPYWLIAFWNTHYGTGSAIRLAQRSFKRADTGILVQNSQNTAPLQTYLRNLEGSKQISSYGFSLSKEAYKTFCTENDCAKLHENGYISYMAAASQIVLERLGCSLWDEQVWDMCAGFGGKSAYLSNAAVPICLCTDTSWKRIHALSADFKRRNLNIPVCIQADASTPPLKQFSGNILLDAPCSGLGVLARRPDIRRYRQKKRSLRLFPMQQKALLEKALHILQKGRELAYITCTLNPFENEVLVRECIQAGKYELQAEWQTPNSHPTLEGMYGALIRKI